MSIVSIIQAMLVPGILISACGLLLLATSNKYSQVINRIRILDEEKRKLKQLEEKDQITKTDKKRMVSINSQCEMLAHRLKFVRNTVIFYNLAIGFFIITGLSIGINFVITHSIISYIIISFFLTGILSILAGVYFAFREAILGYEILQIEIDEHKDN